MLFRFSETVMSAGQEYVQFLNMAVEEQQKANEAASFGLQAESTEHLKRADACREQAKAIFNRHNSKSCPPHPD